MAENTLKTGVITLLITPFITGRGPPDSYTGIKKELNMDYNLYKWSWTFLC